MFKLITLATLLIGAVNCYQETAYSNYQDAFSNYQDYFQEPIKPQNGLAIARQALGGLSSGGAALIGVAAAGTAAAVGTVQNANTNANLDASNRRIDSANTKADSANTKAAATCTALSALVGIAAPTVKHHGYTASSTCTSTTAAAPCPTSTVRSSSGEYSSCATSTPSAGTSDCVASNLLDNYVLQGAVGSATATVAATGGLASYSAKVAGTTFTTTALTINDFNIFRKLVAEGLNTLDKKIESILAITAPSC